MCTCMWLCLTVEARSLLPPCESQGWSSVHQAWERHFYPVSPFPLTHVTWPLERRGGTSKLRARETAPGYPDFLSLHPRLLQENHFRQIIGFLHFL